MDGTFSALMSTNETYYDLDRTKCLTIKLEEMQEGIDNVEEGLGNKAPLSHDHNGSYILKALQMVADNGGAEETITGNVVSYLLEAPVGLHTYYSASGGTRNPKTTEAWRMLVHKTDASNNGWVLAFGSEGSVYEGYINNGVWKGWHCLYDYSPVPLWTGEMYMSTNQSVTPSKSLSNCKNGWMLLWSDYNPGSGSANTDFVTSFIPKRAYSGQAWNGGKFLCAVPRFAEEDGEAITVKSLAVYDTKLEGYSINTALNRNDVVLRAIYEF